MTTNPTEGTAIREQVRERYGKVALRVLNEPQTDCCGSSGAGACCGGSESAITSNLYSGQEASEVPTEAMLASLGCGNPTALARLHPGEVVLDLGSGGGIDVLLSAKRVGPTGFAYGLDMTDAMLALAEEIRQKSGVANVQFLKGYIEAIPLPENTVDVIISNCVINLAADKRPVLREAFRVLKPGGRFAVSDVVRRGEAPAAVLRSMEAWTGCIAGALHVDDYTAQLAEAGFTDIGIEVTRSYGASDVTGESGCCSPADLTGDEVQMADGLFVSAFIRAIKPQG
jgi:arsenite methyltransferase